MYSTIVVPIDLAHAEKLTKALTTAADLAKHYQASVYLVGVTTLEPNPIAHTPDEFKQKFEQFAATQSASLRVDFKPHMATSTDPSIDLDKVLDAQFHALGADLVIMASHVPGFREYVFASNAGFLASHTDLSVFVVR